MSKILQFFFILILVVICCLSISCQTKEQKFVSALERCQAFLDKDDLESATTCYVDVIPNTSNNSAENFVAEKKAFFSKCNYYGNNNNLEKEIACLEGYLKIDKNFANAYFLLGSNYLKFFLNSKRTSQSKNDDLLNRAEEIIKKGLVIEPENATAHAFYGEILSEKNEFEKSLSEYEKAVEFAPEKGIFWVKMAFVQEKLGKDEDAINSYKQALAINPNKGLVLRFLGALYYKSGKCAEGIEMIEKSEKVDPLEQDVLQKFEELKKDCQIQQSNKRAEERAKIKGSNQPGGIVKPKP